MASGFRAIEFYSGIGQWSLKSGTKTYDATGGLHQALMQSGLSPPLQVCCSIDWDQSAAAVYEANYGMKPLQKDISKLTFEDLEPFHANLWLASPACQPYTVLGLQKQERDPRAQSFLHLMTNVLPEMVSRGSNPNYLLVENVAGFEVNFLSVFLRVPQSLSDVYHTELGLGPPAKPRIFHNRILIDTKAIWGTQFTP
ncbi:hypothetical protein FRC15_006349 [Serendipita sp. 397]|nr:hypothetical protein FRC15_006349 [Serendipita sp. 397]